MSSVSEAMCDALATAGIARVWTVGAAAIDGFLDTARGYPGLAVEGVATEKTAGFAADGGTRVAPILGVCAVMGSVGLGVALVTIQTAVLERRPVLFLIGQVDADAPPRDLQDTRESGSRDAAVVAATGCASWSIHSPRELHEAWRDVSATLAQSHPAALLVDESVFRSAAIGPLAPLLPTTPEVNPVVVGDTAAEQVRDSGDSALTRAALFRAVAAVAPGADVFADAGQARLVGAGLAAGGLAVRLHQCPRSASLGWAVPAALGGAVTVGRPVYAVCGDGGLLHSLSALAELGRRSLPVTVLVAVNGILGVDAARGPVVPADLGVPEVDFMGLARSVGVPAITAHTATDLATALTHRAGPLLIVAAVPAFESAPVPQL